VRSSRPQFSGLNPFAVLAAAGIATFLLITLSAPFARWTSNSVSGLPLRVLLGTVVVWLWTLTLSLVYCSLCRHLSTREMLRRSLGPALIAAWTPLVLLPLGHLVPIFIPALALIALFTARQIAVLTPRRLEAPPGVDPLSIGGRPALLPTARWMHYALICSLLAQCAFVLWTARMLPEALFALALAVVVLTLVAAFAGAYHPRRGAAWGGLAVVLCVALAAVALLAGPGGHRSRGRGGFRFGVLTMLRPTPAGSSHAAAVPVDAPINHRILSGVILRPAGTHKPALLLASLPAPHWNSVVSPLHVLFTGEYWIYRRTEFRPPSNSLQRTGSLMDAYYATTDGMPLLVEAHQDLREPVDLSTCGAIEVGVANRDRFPGPVTLEVLVAYGQGRARQIKPVGGQPVVSVPGHGTAHERLRFQVGAVGLRSFDQIVFHFKLLPDRWDYSPRIAIEDIVLLPRTGA